MFAATEYYVFFGSFATRLHSFLYSMAALHTSATNNLLLLMFSRPLRAQFLAVLKKIYYLLLCRPADDGPTVINLNQAPPKANEPAEGAKS